ncbi:MAG: ABC transporter permease [Planctomycetes bacterium]|nr:ABC transporter permease [Planctomycetota bacterium]
MANPVAALGGRALRGAHAALRDALSAGEIFARTLFALRGTSRGARRLALCTASQQIYFTGVQGIPVAGLLAVLLGYGLGQFVGFFGLFAFIPQFLEVLIAYHLAPLIAAIVIVARSAAAVAVELGNMRVAGEIAMLESFGIDPYRHLALPRLLGIVIGTVSLCFVVTAIALVSMMLVVKDHPSVGGSDYLQAIAPRIGLRVAVLGLLYGLAIALVSMRQGLDLVPQYTEVPKAASRAVVKSIVLCALLTGATTLVLGLP